PQFHPCPAGACGSSPHLSTPFSPVILGLTHPFPTNFVDIHSPLSSGSSFEPTGTCSHNCFGGASLDVSSQLDKLSIPDCTFSRPSGQSWGGAYFGGRTAYRKYDSVRKWPGLKDFPDYPYHQVGNYGR
ncbi:unnamed protein product, partial [Ectocarpus fasciculatus]